MKREAKVGVLHRSEKVYDVRGGKEVLIAELPIVLMVLKHRASRVKGASHPPRMGKGKSGKRKKGERKKTKERKKKKRKTYFCLPLHLHFANL